MTIVMNNVGRILDADAFVALDTGSWLIRLFQNNYTPLVTSVSGDFTDPTYDGYTSQTIGGWGAAAIDTDGNATVPGLATRTFQPTGPTSLPQTVYGYWIDDGAGAVIWAERFSASFTFADQNSVLILQPRFSVGGLA